MNKVIDKGFRSCRFVSTIVKHPVYLHSVAVTVAPVEQNRSEEEYYPAYEVNMMLYDSKIT